MANPFKSYKNIQPHIGNLIIAEMFVQLVNAAFMFMLLIYMDKLGYKDHESAHFTKFRFLGVLLLSIPLGLYIKGRTIKPLFYIATVLVPLSAIGIIYSIENRWELFIYFFNFLWGIGFVCIQVSAIPYILRNSSKNSLTEGISLSHSTWSISGIAAGIFIYTTHYFFPTFFNERNCMLVLAYLSFIGVYFVYKISINEKKNDPQAIQHKTRWYNYDWDKIAIGMLPTTLIATGAGLTIPFISLFFKNIHGVNTENFSLLAAFALVFVSYATLLVPFLKNKLGYIIAVPLTQGISIMALVGLATTEYFKTEWTALYIAAFFYIIRQPLMNMAAPMTQEITMQYVGKKNQEMISALTAAVWSGGWFISSYVFEQLRKVEFRFSDIFLITALFYLLGVVFFQFLIRKNNQASKQLTASNTSNLEKEKAM